MGATSSATSYTTSQVERSVPSEPSCDTTFAKARESVGFKALGISVSIVSHILRLTSLYFAQFLEDLFPKTITHHGDYGR